MSGSLRLNLTFFGLNDPKMLDSNNFWGLTLIPKNVRFEPRDDPGHTGNGWLEFGVTPLLSTAYEAPPLNQIWTSVGKLRSNL
jgi:hypothetical protein